MILYTSMSPEYDKSIAFKTACELIFQGISTIKLQNHFCI